MVLLQKKNSIAVGNLKILEFLKIIVVFKASFFKGYPAPFT